MLYLDLQAHMRRAGLGAAMVVVVVLLLAPAPALASDGTIDFSGLANGTVVSNQYQSQGVIFDQSPSGPDQALDLTVQSPSTPPPSPGGKVGKVVCGVESCDPHQSIGFTTPMNHVSLQVTARGATSVTVTAEDGSGTEINSTTATVNNSGFTLMLVSAPGSAASIR